MKMRNKGITLIALVITIIVLLILAGITISLTFGEHGILNMSKQARIKTEEESAREKLEMLLLNMQAEKQTNPIYNKDEYLTAKIEEQDMIIMDGNIILVNGWIFEINRDVPEVSENLGKFKSNDEITKVTLDKEEMIIGITKQENINLDKKDTIKVITEGMNKGQYKWDIENKDIATIDSNGNVTAIASGKTTIKCKSMDGKKIYATCDLLIEEREYLYYHGRKIVNFDEPICGEQGIISESPYFMGDYMYCEFSNKNYPNVANIVNFLTQGKIDFSKYKGVGIKEKIDVTGLGGNSTITLVQTKTCNIFGAIEYGSSGYTCYKGELSSRVDGSKYANVADYDNQAYLNYNVTVGGYNSGIASTADIHIYEIFLVK